MTRVLFLTSLILIVSFPTSGSGTSPTRPRPVVSIAQIQGAAHTSPLDGQTIATTGVVTAVARNGFYLQDPLGDGRPETSEAVFVFTETSPPVRIGDAIRVDGVVHEYLPGGNRKNLTITEIDNASVAVESSGHPLPPPIVIGPGGRNAPSEVIDDDALTSFDANRDGIDFFESLEGMRVRIPSAVAVGITNRFGEIWVVSSMGVGATGIHARGGITVSEHDFNPERIQIDDTLSPDASPSVAPGDRLGDIIGVVSYSFGNYEVLPVTLPSVTPAEHTEETTPLAGDDARLIVASFNVHNLHRGDDDHIHEVAAIIAHNLRSPDVIGLQEIMDDNGTMSDGTVEADETFHALIDAIHAAGGPAYAFRDIAPGDGEDGGIPGGNIRVGFLFNPARVDFVDRGLASATDATSVVEGEDGARLTLNPGRIAPADAAWRRARKPLAGEFIFRDQRFFIIVNHLTSRLSSTPLFGSVQPPVAGGEAKRTDQARAIHNFVEALLAVEAHARIIVLGDFNDFSFSQTLDVISGNPSNPVHARTIPSAALTNLSQQLEPEERYTFLFEGNSQAIDHILVSPSLVPGARYDIVHAAAEFGEGASDHDPVVASLRFPAPAPALATAPALEPNHPNPFHDTTAIRFTTPTAGPVSLRIYDTGGRLVATRVHGFLPKGPHTATWCGRIQAGTPAASGVYWVRLVAGSTVRTRKIVLLR